MSNAIAFLFPWNKTFTRLDLQKRWWHRLAVVLFFLALISVLVVSGVCAFAAYEPYPSIVPDIHFWTTDSNGNQNELETPPEDATQIAPEVTRPDANGFSIGSPSQHAPVLDMGKSIPIDASVEMPNGHYKQFVGTSRRDIEAEWNRALHKAIIKQWLFGICIPILFTLAFNYLLQSSYRALLYVIYGARAGAAAETPVTD